MEYREVSCTRGGNREEVWLWGALEGSKDVCRRSNFGLSERDTILISVVPKPSASDFLFTSARILFEKKKRF